MAVTATWRKMALLLATILVAVAMMAASAVPVLAAPQNPDHKSRNSCGAAGGFEVPPGQTTEELGDCGFRNNPHGGPPGQNK
jgi:hypothetical protein